MYSDYMLSFENFVKMVIAQNKFEQWLNVWAREFKPFVERVVVEALKLYENIHVRMNNMEEQVNNRLWELSILDLARFFIELKQAQANIAKIKRKPILIMFDSASMEIDKEKDIMDLMVLLLKYKGKVISESRKRRSSS